MKYHPILFQTAMVQALIAGTKTQTRRLVKGRGFDPQQATGFHILDCRDGRDVYQLHRPDANGQPAAIGEVRHRYAPGDRLWVRETWADYNAGVSDEMKANYPAMGQPHYVYRADFTELLTDKVGIWKPSIHMPRPASRLTLEVVSVRVERVREISEQDAEAEGVARFADDVAPVVWQQKYVDYQSGLRAYASARDSYRSLWDHINGAGSWEANPWVWVIEFQRVT